MNNYSEEEEAKRVADLQPTQYERESWEGRKMSNPQSVDYCGSCSLSYHVQQVRDPDPWIQSFLPRWYRLYKSSQAMKQETTAEQRVLRKARDLRTALINGGVVVSPNPSMGFDDLPVDRQANWIKLACAYIEVFG